MESNWRAAPLDAYLWCEWDGECVVYVHASGDIHALSPAASAALPLLRTLAGRTLPLAGWCRSIRIEAGEPADAVPDEAERAEVEQFLQGLAALGLVERVA